MSGGTAGQAATGAETEVVPGHEVVGTVIGLDSGEGSIEVSLIP